MNTVRMIAVITLIAVCPVMFVTLQTLRAAWSQEVSPGTAKVMLVGDEVKIDEIKAKLAGAPKTILDRKEIAATLPVTEFFRPGYTAPPLNTSAIAGNDKAWEDLGSYLTKLNNSRAAFEVAEKYIGRRTLGALTNEQLTSFSKELSPLVSEVPTLKDWPNRLNEMSKDVAATKLMRTKLDSITGALNDRINIAAGSLSRIPDADLKNWSKQLLDMEKSSSESVSMDNYPIIVQQHQELKRRVDFWDCWNPPTSVDNTKLTSAAAESRRTALIQLQKTAKASNHGEAQLPEEIAHTEKVPKEIERLVGEGLYLRLKESLASKNNAPKSMAELLQKMEPILATGEHRDELLKEFKSFVEQGLAKKKTRESKLPVYDFALPGGQIWLAHSDRKTLARGSLWIWSYDLDKDEKVELDKEHQYLYPDNGFLKISEPEEVRIVNEFNKSRSELLETLDQIDSWTAMQSKCVELEKQLASYYRQMKQFWDRPETGKHRLAPNLSFTADEKLISEVLEHWSVVESLHRR